MVRGAATASATKVSDQDQFIVVERLLKATQLLGRVRQGCTNMTNYPVTPGRIAMMSSLGQCQSLERESSRVVVSTFMSL